MEKATKETLVYYLIRDDLRYNTKSKLRYYLNEHKIFDIDIHNLYVRLINYRIKKYGTSMVDAYVVKSERHKYILNSYKKGGRKC
jgi:hypothetical protein